MAKRIQMTRHKPWRKDNPDAVIVARPSKFGNPYSTPHAGVRKTLHRIDQVRAYRWFLTSHPLGKRLAQEARAELRGKDLACWCGASEACHADVLLEIANESEAN